MRFTGGGTSTRTRIMIIIFQVLICILLAVACEGEGTTGSRGRDIGDAYFRKVGADIVSTNVNSNSNYTDTSFGVDVSMSGDGKRLAVVGSEPDRLDKVYLYQYNEDNDDWVQALRLDFPIGFTRVSISGEGSTLAVANYHVNFELGHDQNKTKTSGGVSVFRAVDDGNGNGQFSWPELGNAEDIDVLGYESGGNLGTFPGLNIALSHDGNALIAGSPNFGDDQQQGQGEKKQMGRARVFLYDDHDGDSSQGRWRQMKADIVGDAEGDRMGMSVDILKTDISNELYIIVGAIGKDGMNENENENGSDGGVRNNSGMVRVYKHLLDDAFDIEDEWTQVGGDLVGEGAEDLSGFSVSIAETDDLIIRVAIGAIYNDGSEGINRDAGHVRVYDLIQGTWVQVGNDVDGENGLSIGNYQGYYHVGDSFGFSVDMSKDGKRIVAGAPLNNGGTTYYGGHTRMYDYIPSNNTWAQVAEDIDGDSDEKMTGYSVALSDSGKVLAVGGPTAFDASDPGSVIVWYQDEMSNEPSKSPTPTLRPSSHPSVSMAPSKSVSPTLSPSDQPTLSMVPSSQPSTSTITVTQHGSVKVESNNIAVCDQKDKIRDLVVPVMTDVLENNTVVEYDMIKLSDMYSTNCPIEIDLESRKSPRSLNEGNNETEYEYFFEFILEVKQTALRKEKDNIRDPPDIKEVVDFSTDSFNEAVSEEVGIDLNVVIYDPIESPSAMPSSSPTGLPSSNPSQKPSALPSHSPTDVPSHSPSVSPSSLPTPNPSTLPSHSPSISPSMSHKPSAWVEGRFKIMTVSNRYDRTASKDWCITVDKITTRKHFYVRPCDARIYGKKQVFTQTEEGFIMISDSNFCMQAQARTLRTIGCDSSQATEFNVLDETSTRISTRILPRSRFQYVGIHSFKTFSKLRMFREDMSDKSTEEWRIMFHD